MQPTNIFAPKPLGTDASLTGTAGGMAQGQWPLASTAQAVAVVDLQEAQALGALDTLVLPDNFPLPLTPEQLATIQSRVNEFSLTGLATRDIPKMGISAEMALGSALDAFLSRIDKQGSPALFKLTDELAERFDDAKLEEVADKILNTKPSLWARLYGMLNKKFLRDAVARAYEDVSRMAQGRSKTLADHVNALQRKLEAEMRTLGEELTQMDKLKAAYRASLVSFAEETAVLHNVLMKARLEFAASEDTLKQDPQAYQEALDKLQALESRALAVEGGLTRLPTDQILIRQLQTAGVTTLQELGTTMGSRFNSIKAELLAVHAGLAVKTAQRLGEQGAALDANLGKVRGKLVGEVVTTAATMAGKNRLQQAEQIKGLVRHSRELQQITTVARAENEKMFQSARESYATTRQELLALGMAVQPSQNVSGSF